MRSLYTTVAVAVIALAAGAAQANTVQLNSYTYGSGSVNVNVVAPGVPKTYSGGAGEFTGTLDGQSFQTYCLDIYQNFWFGGVFTDYSVVTLGATKASNIGNLVTAHRAEVDTAAESAAFQLALWELMYETTGTFDLTQGTFSEFSTTSAIRDLAQGYLNTMGNVSNVYVQLLESPTRQDFLVTTPIPEPSTWALMLAGLAGTGFMARRRLPQR